MFSFVKHKQAAVDAQRLPFCIPHILSIRWQAVHLQGCVILVRPVSTSLAASLKFHSMHSYLGNFPKMRLLQLAFTSKQRLLNHRSAATIFEHHANTYTSFSSQRACTQANVHMHLRSYQAYPLCMDVTALLDVHGLNKPIKSSHT